MTSAPNTAPVGSTLCGAGQANAGSAEQTCQNTARRAGDMAHDREPKWTDIYAPVSREEIVQNVFRRLKAFEPSRMAWLGNRAADAEPFVSFPTPKSDAELMAEAEANVARREALIGKPYPSKKEAA